MSDDNIVEKVAARLSLDISPGQEKLDEFAGSFEQFKDKAAAAYSLFGQALIEATSQNGVALQELSSSDQAKILQIQQDGELRRQMVTLAFQQQMVMQQQEFGARMQNLESEAQTTRESVAKAAAMQTLAILSQAEIEKTAILEESTLRQQALDQKILQQTEQHEEKMAKLRLSEEQNIAKSMAALEESALRREALNQKIEQNQQAHEERMTRLQLQTARQQQMNDEAALRRQPVTMDSLHYAALKENAEREKSLLDKTISEEMNEIKGFYQTKTATAEESLTRIQELLTVEAEYFAENQNKKLQLMKLEASIRQDVAAQELAIDMAFVRALQENRNLELQAQDEMITRKLQKIRSYYDIELLTAKDALAQVEELMNQETAYFQANQDKQLQAMKMAYQMRNDIKAQQLTGGLPSGLGSFLGNAASFASGMALFAVLNQLMQIPKTMEDISGSVTKLKQVLELSDQIKSVQQLDDSVNQLQDVGKQMAVIYGQNVSTVLDVMTEAGRRFKDLPSIIVATDNALQVMTADNVDATLAIKGEEAMMSQFGLTIGETRDAWAKITVAAHEFQANASDIISGLERSGSAFNGMKINTNGAIAALVALQQESGRTGAVVGNSWKSIENTLGSDKGVKALHDLGIEARASNGALEDGLTVLGELQKKWPELSEASRVAFATTLAGGKYQYQQLLTFLDNTSGTFTRALDSMNKATVEDQQKLVESAMESLPKQQQMTVAALQAMTSQYTQSLTPALISFYTELRNGSKFMDDHVQTMETLLGVGMKLAEGYVAWKVGIQLYNAALDSAIVKQSIIMGKMVQADAIAAGASKGFATLKGAIYGVADAAAVTVGRLAILAGAVEIFNNIAARNADPLGEKEKDLQAQLDALQTKKQDEQEHGTGIWSQVVQGWDLFKQSGANILNPQRANAILDGFTVGNTMDDSQIDAQISDVKKQLAGVQKQKDDQQKADFEKYQKMIDDAMNAADKNHLPAPPLDNGPDTTMPGDSSASQSAAAYARPFTDSIKSIEDGLGPLNNMTKALDSTLSTLTYHQETLNNSLKFGSTNANLASDAFQTYSQRMSAYKTQQDALHTTNEQTRTDLVKIAAQMQAVNPKNADPTTLSQGQQDALSSLSQEYDKLSSELDQNSQKWQQDARDMIQATDDWANSLKQLQANQLAPLDSQLKTIENHLKSTQALMSMDKSKMDHGDSSLATLTDYAKQYQDQLAELGQKEETINQQRAMHEQQIKDLEAAIAKLDKTSAGYDDALQNLTQQINDHKSALADLDDQYAQTDAAVQTLKDSMESLIEDSLKSGYEAEQKLQDQKLKEKFDAQTASIQKQIDAIDEQISAYDQLNQAQDEAAKLADLQNQLNQVESQHDHEYIGTNGKLSYTYDMQKATDLQKQIADEQKTIQRNQYKQQLEDQKKALQDKLKQVQDEYQQEKEALDAYWNYRLQQDQLKQDAERLIAQKGYANALADAKQFASDMNKEFANINWAQIQVGAGIAGGLPGGIPNPGAGTPNISQEINTADDKYQKAKTQAEKDKIHADLAKELSGSGAVYDSNTGVWSLNGVALNGANAGKKIASLDTGGAIPHGVNGLSVIHQDEVVINAPTVENFKAVPPALADLKAQLSELPRMFSPALLQSVSHSTTVHQTVHLTAEFPNVRSQSDAQGFGQQLAVFGKQLYRYSAGGTRR